MNRTWAAATCLIVGVPSGGAVAQERGPDAAGAALLAALRGSWEFTLQSHDAARPALTGRRVFEEFVRDRILTWTEEFDGRDVRIFGVIGWDPSRARFYELGSTDDGPVDHWVGEPTSEGLGIVWSDPLDREAPSRGRLDVIDDDRFTYSNDEFRVMFVRTSNPAGRGPEQGEKQSWQPGGAVGRGDFDLPSEPSVEASRDR